MLRNSLTKLTSRPVDFKWWMAIVLPLWVGAGFILAQVIVGLVLGLIDAANISLAGINDSSFQTIASGVIYLLSIGIVIGVPWIVKKYKTSRDDLGLREWPAWIDLLIAPGAFIAYVLLSYIFTTLAMHLPFYNAEQVQDTGFTQLTQGYEYLLAFVTLVVIAPIAEEILFRGYLLGKLRKHVSLWVSILITSLLFAVVHFQFNVGVDVFALSIVLCLLRVWTGRLAPAILLHMIKNGIAFYFLFINPFL